MPEQPTRKPTPLVGLPPIVGSRPHTLVLGSMPGARSLQEQAYYAHPHNRFWWLMGELLGFPADLDYAGRVDALRAHGIALWDVLASCERAGSLDSAIVLDSAQVNDLPGFLARQASIRTLLFNGSLAWRVFERRVVSALSPAQRRLPRHRLPSTSPAHASLTPAQKLAAWRAALEPHA